jgi:hypothetical protein
MQPTAPPPSSSGPVPALMVATGVARTLFAKCLIQLGLESPFLLTLVIFHPAVLLFLLTLSLSPSLARGWMQGMFVGMALCFVVEWRSLLMARPKPLQGQAVLWLPLWQLWFHQARKRAH